MRSAVGVFDVSHLGKARVSGPGARDFLNTAFTADLAPVEPGSAKYTMCCTESGGVVDDLIAYVYGDDDVFLVPNAANTAEIARLLTAAAPAGIEVVNQHRDYAVLAVQGPSSPQAVGGARASCRAAVHVPSDGAMAGPAGDRVPFGLHR